MVRKPVRTLLAGEELAAHQRELERVKRLKEENAQRKRREEELAAVSAHPTISLSLFLVQSSTAARCKMPFIRLITHCLLYSTLLCSSQLAGGRADDGEIEDEDDDDDDDREAEESLTSPPGEPVALHSLCPSLREVSHRSRRLY
jgi:hypothetical protein